MMHQKALTRGDQTSASRIIRAPSAKEALRLGRAICSEKNTPFDTGNWRDPLSYDVVLTGDRANFTQINEAKQVLMGAGTRELVEASPHDGI